ncbi:MAG TPA: hypothetical protein VEW69_03420, partial [Alphaproteobacteria bacterium]|nr:hypothetical protein [Alphaproteobacteria bacterium]
MHEEARGSGEQISLNQQLEELTAKLREMVPAERLATVESAVAKLQGSGMAERALKPGDTAPVFELPDGDGM